MAGFEILLWDDGSPLFRTLSWVLDYKGYKVATVFVPETAIEALATKNYDLLIANLPLGPENGLEVVKRAKKLNPEIRVILVGNDGQVAFPLEAYRLKIDDYVLMPCTPAELWRRVATCLGNVKTWQPEADHHVRLAAINERVLNKLAVVFHDIRSSMVSTSSALKLLLRGAHGEMDATRAQKLREVDARVRKIIGVSEEFVTQVLSGKSDVTLGSELLDLREEIVAPVLEELSEEIRDHRITIDNRLSLLPAAVAIPVKGSKLYLKSVFRNLLDNGIKHGGDGCTIVIDLEDGGDNCRLQVYNSGKPVPEENRALLFSHARRLGKGGKSQGLGLGLSLVRDIMKEYGGDVWYEAKNDGSNFVISFPNC